MFFRAERKEKEKGRPAPPKTEAWPQKGKKAPWKNGKLEGKDKEEEEELADRALGEIEKEPVEIAGMKRGPKHWDKRLEKRDFMKHLGMVEASLTAQGHKGGNTNSLGQIDQAKGANRKGAKMVQK